MKSRESAFDACIQKIMLLLRERHYEQARVLIHEAMAIDDNSAEAQNLIGAYYELTGDRLLALRHYRAAYALEPSYEYANMNIERLTYNNLIGVSSVPLLGDEDLSAYKKVNQVFEKMR